MKKDNWVAYGIVFGTLVGLFTENLGLWLALGVALGAGMSEVKKDKLIMKKSFYYYCLFHI